MKQKKKALPKPITTVIEITFKTWYDKTYGNLYCSARAYVNMDYDRPLFYEMDNDGPINRKWSILADIGKQYKGLADIDLCNHSMALARGVYINVQTFETTKAECKRFGHANN